MTALKGRAIDDFLKRGPKGAPAVLVYGPDQGLVRERADALARALVPDFKDPFNYIELSDADLKGEPARLADEAVSLSFSGGERVVRYAASGEAAPPAVQTLIAGLDGGSLKPCAVVIVEAGDLSRRSSLRLLFEKSKAATALPCYADGAAELRTLAADAARAEALTFDEDALDLLVSLLGEDRGVSRSEIGKLLLFKGAKTERSEDGTITADDVRALLADGAGEELDEAAAAAAGGDAKAAARALWKSAAAGASPISLIRALFRQMTRLGEAHSLISGGAGIAEAMERLRPPVFFAEKRAFEARLKKWSRERIDAAFDLLIEAEFDAKTTGAPQREIAERAALRIARLARGNGQ